MHRIERFAVLCLTPLLVFSESAAEAQSVSGQIVEACQAVYESSSADIRSLSYEYSQYIELQKHICDGKSSKSNVTLNVVQESVVENFAKKFGLSFGSSKEKAQLFCERITEKNDLFYEFDLFERRVNNESQSNLNACLKLAAQQAYVTHTVDYPSKVTITFKNTSSSLSTTIKSIAVTGRIACQSPQYSSFLSSQLSERSEYNFVGDFAIVCTRSPSGKISGDDFYDRASITISTDNFDTYSVTLMEDRYLSPQFAREANDRINSLLESISKNELIIQEIESRLRNAEERINSFHAYSVVLLRGDTVPAMGIPLGGRGIWPGKDQINKAKRIGCPIGAAFQGEVDAACKAGYRVSSSEHVYDVGGGTCGMQITLITCVRD